MQSGVHSAICILLVREEDKEMKFRIIRHFSGSSEY